MAQTLEINSASQTALLSMEEAIKQYDGIVQILVFLNELGERGPRFHESLAGIVGHVADLKNEKLNVLFGELLNGYQEFDSQDKIELEARYAAFLKRLGRLGDAAAMQANEADIELKRILGLGASFGIYGPPFWKAPKN